VFSPDNQVVDKTLKGQSLPLVDGVVIVKSSDEVVVGGIVSYWFGEKKD
jgi:hypothetical protein